MRAGLVDVDFYAALRGCEFADELEAAEDFVERGMPERLTPHPLLDFLSLPSEIRRAWRRGCVAEVLDYLTPDGGRAGLVGPLTNVDEVPARKAMIRHARRLGSEAAGRVGPGSTRVDWRVLEGRKLHPGRASVVVVAAEPKRTVRAVKRLLRHAHDCDVEIIVVDSGSEPHVGLHLVAALHQISAAQVVRLPSHVPTAAAVNLGVAIATGETTVIIEPHAVVRRGWLPASLAQLRDPDVGGVQPLILDRNDAIRSAGLVVTAGDEAVVPLLRGHPKEDARRLEGESLAAISGEVMVLRTRDLLDLRGVREDATWEEASLDLCARLLQHRHGGFRVAASSLVTATDRDPPAVTSRRPPGQLPSDPSILRRVGFLTELPGDTTITGRRRDSADQLRWSLKLPSSPGPGGDRWGDTHFAEALAGALRSLGQDVVTCRRGAHTAGPTHLDDVSLALRGLYPIDPMPGQVNVLWVISHPDDVNPDEFDGYDLVFAASHAWAEQMSARGGRSVFPLLQASEFVPPAVPSGDNPDRGVVVFVGNNGADRERPLVWQAVEAGVPLAVYGRGWEDLPEGLWRGDYVDNHRLPELYHRHGIVLADHWPDMARNGFVANRVFDAVAAGAKVICDDVVGVHDVFDPREVVVARSSRDITAAVARWCASAPEQVIGSPRALSFTDRASTLLRSVLPLSQSSEDGRRRG